MAAREVLRMLKNGGWFVVETEGSHYQLKRPVKKGRVTAPVPSETVGRQSPDEIAVLVTAYPELFRERRESRKVRMNVTISSGLKRLAQKENINCSQVLEVALRDILGVSDAPRRKGLAMA